LLNRAENGNGVPVAERHDDAPPIVVNMSAPKPESASWRARADSWLAASIVSVRISHFLPHPVEDVKARMKSGSLCRNPTRVSSTRRGFARTARCVSSVRRQSAVSELRKRAGDALNEKSA
jgi:hypothetical protein